MRRLTEAVYDGAALRRGDHVEPVRRRVLPGPGALVVVAVVVVLITSASVWRHLSPPGGDGATVESGGAVPASVGTSGEPGGDPAEQEGRVGGGAGAPTGTPGPTPQTSGTTTSPPGGPRVVVYVTGRVVSPGVVELDTGSRVLDAVNAVGGPLPDADLESVNMARILVDGEHIVLHRPGEGPAPSAGPAGSGGPAPAAGSTCVDLNTADEQALQALDGIGPALAARIVAHREQVGSFTSVEELDDVSGIGPTLVQRISQGTCQ